MNKIGIMQGRVIPERLDKLQIFPESHWEEELEEIKRLKFDYVELLFDKELVLKKLISRFWNLQKLGINSKKDGNYPSARSVCADYFSSLSFLNDEQNFFDTLKMVMKIFEKSSVKILVLPFFENNLIQSPGELSIVLEKIEGKKLDEIVSDSGLILALELTLPAEDIRKAMEGYHFNNIRISYDTGNARASGYSPEDEIAVLGDLIAHLHIKDRKFKGPNVMLGTGDVDFKACFASLKDIKYEGLMILETIYSDSPIEDAKRNLLFVNEALAEVVR